jgi:hypothetical protein
MVKGALRGELVGPVLGIGLSAGVLKGVLDVITGRGKEFDCNVNLKIYIHGALSNSKLSL